MSRGPGALSRCILRALATSAAGRLTVEELAGLIARQHSGSNRTRTLKWLEDVGFVELEYAPYNGVAAVRAATITTRGHAYMDRRLERRARREARRTARASDSDAGRKSSSP